jgi:histone H4
MLDELEILDMKAKTVPRVCSPQHRIDDDSISCNSVDITDPKDSHHVTSKQTGTPKKPIMLNVPYCKRAKGVGKGGKHKFRIKQPIAGITKNSIKRLARRGGVKRLSQVIYDETRNVLKSFLQGVLSDAIEYTLYAQKNTVTVMHVAMALKRRGHTLYGFTMDEPKAADLCL